MAGSLFFSEVLGWLPCQLCWYQRIAMYPLVLLLLIGILTRDRKVFNYVIPLALIGAAISTYHVLYQKTNWFPASPCELSSGVSCKGDYLNWLNGLITIPTLALLAFVLVALSGVLARMADLPDEFPAEDEGEETDGEARPRVSPPVTGPAFPLRLAGALLAIGAALALVFIAGDDLRASRPPKATPALPSGAPASPFATPVANLTAGARLYSEYCAMCHGPSGDGLSGLAPTLSGSALVKSGTEDELLRMIRKGRAPNDPDNKSGLQMPQSGGMSGYSDDELRAVIKYVKAIVR